MGHGRSPTLVIAYFILHQRNSYSEAINRVIKQRPEIHLEEDQVKALKSIKTNL
jgi:protein-tyrosine phosphatase